AAPAAAPPAAAKPAVVAKPAEVAQPAEAKPVVPAPEPAVAVAVEVEVAAAQSAEPITVSEPPSPISLPPSALEDAPRESLPELVPRESSEISLANLSNLAVQHQAPPPVPAAAH